jgi:hypothetical protein
MAQDKGLVLRGLLLLGFMLGLAALVSMVLWFRREPKAREQAAADLPGLVALSAVPSAGPGFPASVNWPALAKLSESLPSSTGWEIRYNAAIALARRGSCAAPFDTLSEMLDEDLQMRNFRVKLADGKEVPDEAAARRTVLNALQALVEWNKVQHCRRWRDKDRPQWRQVGAAIAQLMHSPNVAVKDEAEKTKKELGLK